MSCTFEMKFSSYAFQVCAFFLCTIDRVLQSKFTISSSNDKFILKVDSIVFVILLLILVLKPCYSLLISYIEKCTLFISCCCCNYTVLCFFVCRKVLFSWLDISFFSAFSNDTSCMQFPIPAEYFDKSVQLKNGDIKVFIRVKNKKNKRKKKVSLKISLVTDNKKSVTIASRKFKLRKTAWQHIHLPATLIKSIQKQHMDVLKICIHCNRCRRKVKIELPTRPNTKRKKRKNKNGRRRRKQRVPKLRKNRPKLLLYSKSTEVSVRNRRHVPSECSSKCCKRAQFIQFSSLHLPQEVEFPKGFLFEQCTTMCSENDASTQSHDVIECKSVRKDPLNLNIKFKDGIQFNLSIPNAKVSTCQFHIQ